MNPPTGSALPIRMINHDLKCIFIHIPRCGGTSIENWLCGEDWWNVDPTTKHLIASQAKQVYAEYWDEYFKFSFVREPVGRVLSCLKYPSYFNLSLTGRRISFRKYKRRFRFGKVILEHDYRFARGSELVHDGHMPKSVFGNILDCELDFVGHLENIKKDCAMIARQLGVRKSFDSHVEQSSKPTSESELSKWTVKGIKTMFEADYERFGING